MFPSNYEPPASSSDGGNYTKITDNETAKLRILSEAVVGYSYWTNENKCIRSELRFESTPNIREGDKPKHFWAFKVWNYTTKQVEIWEITQASIRDALWGFWKDEEYGDLRNYGLKITRSGQKLNTKYQVIAMPPKEIAEDVAIASANTPVNLYALFEGANPFAKADDAPAANNGGFDEDF